MKSRFLSAALVAALLTLVPAPGASGASSDDAPGPRPTNVPHVVEPLPHLENLPAPTTDAASAPSKGAAVGLAIPALHSRASSTHTVFLDFDGVNLWATNAWTDEPDSITAGAYTGYSLDGSLDFNQTEIDAITKIWRIVAEKYSTYDVDVTTVDPGQDALTRINSSDEEYGVQVVFNSQTGASSPKAQVCNDTCAGIAWSDLFDGRPQNTGGGSTAYNTADYTIAWVFPSTVVGSTATAAAHEVGHTLGLDHDGGSANPNYYGGHGNWVPIMGISTNGKAVSQFSKGEYSGATNTEDDLAVISTNGFAGTSGTFTLPDDYTTSGGAPTGAAVLGDQTSYTKTGVITNAADDDVFSISRTCTTPIVASATGIGAGQSVDLKVEIQDAAGNVLVSDDPVSSQVWVAASSAYEPTGMDATATLSSPSSGGTTYRIKVDGVGNNANPSASYSSYGSIGPYTLTVSGCPGGASNVPGAPASASTVPAVKATTGTISWTAPADDGGSAVTNYRITGLPGGTVDLGNVLTYDAPNLNPGTTYNLTIAAKNANGFGATRATSIRVATWVPTTKPTLAVTRSGTTATLTYAAPSNPGRATLTSWFIDRTGPGTSPADKTVTTSSTTMAGLIAGTHSFRVRPIYTADDTGGVVSSDPKSIVVTTKPSAPRIGTPSSGKAGGTKNATARWAAPTSTGGSAIKSYKVVAYKIVGGKITRTYVSRTLSASARAFVFVLPGGSYKFRVVAYNAVGASPGSAYSKVVASR